MGRPLRLLCILAHPDDETLGLGGTLATYSAEGIQTYVLLASRGERGRNRASAQQPTPEALGSVREREARAAGAILGVHEMMFLGLPDSGLDRADPTGSVGKIAAAIRSACPQVVVTFPPDGGDGHPDHIAVSQLATAAVACAADAASVAGGDPPHLVSKLYYFVLTRAAWDVYQAVFDPPRLAVDGIERSPSPWPDWAVTTEIDTAGAWRTVWEAVQCHRTQIAGWGRFAALDEQGHRALWGPQRFYRAYSLVNSGRDIETDLFAGLR